MGPDEDELYRSLIDRLVDDCATGPGQIAVRRARQGIWNREASETLLPEQHRMNVLLSELPADKRDVVAERLAETYVAGVFGGLVALSDNEIPPFDMSYEGTPFHDFMGRRNAWEWPLERQRSR